MPGPTAPLSMPVNGKPVHEQPEDVAADRFDVVDQLRRRIHVLASRGLSEDAEEGEAGPVVEFRHNVGMEWTRLYAGELPTSVVARNVELPAGHEGRRSSILAEWDPDGPAGDVFGVHEHEEDETFFVVEGEVEIFLLGKRVRLRQHEAFTVARGTKHSARVLKKACLFITYTPALPFADVTGGR